jgi:hypothetical protein
MHLPSSINSNFSRAAGSSIWKGGPSSFKSAVDVSVGVPISELVSEAAVDSSDISGIGDSTDVNGGGIIRNSSKCGASNAGLP